MRKHVYNKKSDCIPGFPDHRYVVYPSRKGKTEAGVHIRRVTLSGKFAFVHPIDNEISADILPTMNVFRSKKAAEEFYVQDGALRWVVSKQNGGAPLIFQARVKTVVTKRSGGMSTRIVMARVDSKPVELHWDMVDFATEREAYRHLKSTVGEDFKKTTTRIKELQKIRIDLLKIQRKIRYFQIDRSPGVPKTAP